MKAYSIKNLLTLLLLTVATVGVYAQKEPAGWRLYQYGNGMTGGWTVLGTDGSEGMTLKSLKFTDKAYDTFAYTVSKGAKDDGRWYMEVRGSGALSIATVKVGIVPAEYTDSVVEAKFQEDSLTDLREVDMNNNTTVEFLIEEDGSYKPVAFGFDEQGIYRSFAVGLAETFTTAIDCNALLYAGSGLNSGRADDYGYGSLMHIRDMMGEEYATPDDGYNWYRTWAENTYMGSKYAYSQIAWKTLDTAIGSLEDIIDMLQKRSEKAPIDKASYGTALAMRAMLYMDAARMYEFLDNDGIMSAVNAAGNNVSGLTYPIGSSAYYQKDSTATAKRATRQEIADYILKDLNQAEGALTGTTTSSKLQADLGVVYGLKARFYLWTEDYEQAKAYAEEAINYGQHTPLTKEEWLSTTRGFNDSSMSSWMWAMNYPKDSYPVNGYANWTSWCSNELLDGYAGIGVYSMIGKSIYDRMSDTDFRKLSFKAPYGSTLSGQEPYIPGGNYDYLPEYASLKFRPGQGEIVDYHIASAVDVPLMRIEEMYFIRCEADAQLNNLEAAKQELTDIMKYRDANYTTTASDKQSIIDEIFLQKRIEFWGEGLNYFDYKRLNKPVTRNYGGTNFDYAMQINTTTRPAWMNFVFVMNAYNGAIEDWNNPDPSDCYNIGTR